MVFENSRYLQTIQYNREDRDGIAITSTRFRHEFNPQTSTMYQVIAGDTLDGLAYKLYGDTELRWVLLDANPKYRTEFDIKVGDYIMIPDFDEVWDYVNSLNTGEDES